MSAFHLLKIPPESSRTEIDSAHEDAGFDERASEDILQKAVDTLTAPMPRLREEMSYFWGIPIPQIDKLNHLSKTDTDGYISCKKIREMSLSALTKANLAAHLCGHGNADNANNLIDALNLLIVTQKDIDTEEIGEMINHARKKSAVVPAAKPDHIINALAKLREEIHIKSAINVIFNVEHPGDLATEITEKYRFDNTPSGHFVTDLIRGAYKNRIQDILNPLEEEIDQAADILWDSPRDIFSLHLIEEKLSEWDEYAQPIQLIDEKKGFDEKRSSEICEKLRNLSLHLHNNEGESEISLRITKLLNKVFPELPETAEYLAKDLDALEKIVDENNQDAKFNALFQAFKDEVEDFHNKSGDIQRLIGVLSLLYSEYPTLAADEKLWIISRNIAIKYYNEYNATEVSSLLTKELLSLAIRFNAPLSISDKLNKDSMFFDKIHRTSTTVKKKSSTYKKPLIILSIIAIISLYIYFASTQIFLLGPQKNPTNLSSRDHEINENKNHNVYVIVSKLNVRNSPNGEIIGYYNHYQTLNAIGFPNNGWQKIAWKTEQKDDYTYGYVWKSYIKNGDGAQAKIEDDYAAQNIKCKESIDRPKNGTLLSDAQRIGGNAISVQNGGNSDVIIKLRDQLNNVLISFYLRKNESYTYRKIPNEMLLFTYATGKNYSVGCGVFMDDMRAHRETTHVDYSSKIWTYTLKSRLDGNFLPKIMDTDDF